MFGGAVRHPDSSPRCSVQHGGLESGAGVRPRLHRAAQHVLHLEAPTEHQQGLLHGESRLSAS